MSRASPVAEHAVSPGTFLALNGRGERAGIVARRLSLDSIF